MNELLEVLPQLTDEEVGNLLGAKELWDFIASIVDIPTLRSEAKPGTHFAQLFLTNRNRAQTAALIHYFAVRLGTAQVKMQDGSTAYVSPHFSQWFDEGIMLLEGDQPFAGLISHYQDGRATYAVAKRDFAKGEEMGRDDFIFVDQDEVDNLIGTSPPEVSRLDEPLNKLKSLLGDSNNDESKYQELIREFPWILGAQHQDTQRHTNLDEENIPDFTGIRVHDGSRDIFEIKPPFMRVGRKTGNLTQHFNDAYDQAARYLNFAREQRQYLRDKGLRFENPACYLIMGYQLDEDTKKELRLRQKNNPAIQIITYDELLTFVSNTIKFVKSLREDAVPTADEDKLQS